MPSRIYPGDYRFIGELVKPNNFSFKTNIQENRIRFCNIDWGLPEGRELAFTLYKQGKKK